MGSPRGFDILGGSEFRLRHLFCIAKQIGAPLRVPSSMGPFFENRFKYSAVAECLNLVSKGQNRTLKTEQSNQKYEEQATEGNKHFIVELFV